MAGLDWVQVDSGFSTSLPVALATDVLGMDPRTFTGAMVDLQDWAVRNLPTGRFGGAASGGQSADALGDERLWAKTLERVVRWDGAAGAFWSALELAGFLVREGGSVRLTLCDRYVQVLEKRAKEAERKRKSRALAASGGRPADGGGTSTARKRKREEGEGETTAAAGGGGSASGGRPRPVPPPTAAPPEDVPAVPVQRSLPGAHLVPASAPRSTSVGPPSIAGAPPPSPSAPGTPAAALWECLQGERLTLHPGLVPELAPRDWEATYRAAVEQLGAEERLLESARGYLRSDWARSREPRAALVVWCRPGVWPRYVASLREAPAAAQAVDESTEAGRCWARVLEALRESGREYVASQLAAARPLALEGGELVLEARDKQHAEWLAAQCGELLAELGQHHGYQVARFVAAARSGAA